MGKDINFIEKKLELIEKSIAFMRQDMSKIATKEQVKELENNLLKWMVSLFLITWGMLAVIAFKISSM
jgi:hypothetical protein